MPTKLLRTSGFRIAVVYLLLLSTTLLVLVTFVYWSTANLIERQMNETIEAEIKGMAEQYRDNGLARLRDVVGERSGLPANSKSIYLLADSSFALIAGNLTAWPEIRADDEGWFEIPVRQGGEISEPSLIVRGRAFSLSGGYHLLVGHDTKERDNFRSIMIAALAWAFVPALLLGLSGGALIGRYSLRRVDAVRATTADIVGGDMARRVALNGSGDEFDRLAQTINNMLDQIDILMTGMRTVTDSLAHDLRSPLTHVKSIIETALRKDSDAEHYKLVLEQTGEELETILRTFEALTNIAQAEAGINKLSFGTLDLSALVSDLVEVFQPIAEDAGLSLSAETAPAVAINGHRQLLGQAIANLLDNAIKFTPSGGRIQIWLTMDQGIPILAICDSGKGIPPDDRERVLQRFVRLDDSRGTPGSGLGLSLVAAVAKLHGAWLELGDCQPGLRVTLTFQSR